MIEWQIETEKILDSAWKKDRTQLYEHEVYKILSLLGIRTPVHHRVKSEDDINRDLLSQFGSSKVVLKIISPKVAHKQKLGGVKVIYKDLDFVRFSVRQMLDTFISQEVPVEGVLLVDFVEYSPELGNEILMGFQESGVFGPVLSFSKGGSDAELFAKHFSAPNLLLPPVTREWAGALLGSTEIHNKYEQEGKADYIDRILEVKIKFSELSMAFSQFFDSESAYFIKEFEINPFVFNPDGNFVALDGYAVFDKKMEGCYKCDRPDKKSLTPFFHPEGVAVVGVSSGDPKSPGSVIAANMIKIGREDLFCVNPRGGRAEIAGQSVKLHKNLTALPSVPDLVIITVPAEASLEVVREAAGLRCGALLLIPGGFTETGRSDLEEEIKRIAEDAGIRVMGPNCLGILYADDKPGRGLNTFFIPESKFKLDLNREKNIALFSQSGALGLVELTNLKDSASPKVAVSYGNQLDVDPGDLVEYFQDEDGIKAIGIYIEGFKPAAGRRFFEITRRSRIPIVVYKAGRTAAGQLATQSHTASMAGEYAVARAAMKQAGLVVADTMADHQGCLKIFALLHGKKVGGRRIVVVTNAGYEKANAADNMKELELAELSARTSEALAEALPSFVTVEPLLDLTPMVNDEVFARSVELMLEAPEVDAVCVSIVPHAGIIHTTDEEVDSYEGNLGARLAKIAAASDKPMVVSLTATGGGDDIFGRMIEVMDSGGLPTYLSAEQAMSYLNEFIRYHYIREQNLLDEWIK
ncbi:MAG: acetate--CoA ligase family protein [Spirochaetales bacterium]|uniref:Acetate--CoA ligase family protein n=1 Tax=Candidatus Thalassospirochaeta sargassi TaxID=3119039 RepID=A0AAJ1IHY9_9SPIO|nr:acetate--CoA ligase family protein [Spirochaetales bacterium]